MNKKLLVIDSRFVELNNAIESDRNIGGGSNDAWRDTEASKRMYFQYVIVAK